MTEVFPMTLSLACGFGAGVLFFGGLWLTVRHLDRMKHPGPAIMLSSVVRTAMVLGLVWWMSRGGLIQIALCLAGFLIARFLLIKAVRNSTPGEPKLSSEDQEKSCT